MSITSDIRAYADKAQAQLNDVTGQANEFVGKLTAPVKNNVSELRAKTNDAVGDLRAQADKAVNLDALKNAVEPYLSRVKGYRAQVTERAEALLEKAKADRRVGKYAQAFEDRVVKPVRELANRGKQPAVAAKPAAKPVAAPKPAAPVASKPSPVKATKAAPRATATKPAVKAGPAKATKAPAAKATTTTRTAAKKAAPAKKA